MGQEILRLKRFEDWPLRLSRFITESRPKRFAWGTHDCLLFAADTIVALTGHDFGAGIRGQYGNEDEAMQIVARFGAGVDDVVRAFLGEPLEYPLKARRGDVVVAEIKGRRTGGIVDDTGRRALFIAQEATASGNMVSLPLSQALTVWGY